MNRTKIQFSAQEMDLLADPGWILTKNSILEKVQLFLGELLFVQHKIIEQAGRYLPAEVVNTSAKISKGENYKGLPWRVLDYPRYFVQEDVFAVRTMFWWGHFFSTTLHLSGRFKPKFQQNILSALPQLDRNDFYICINEHQWHHTFEADNYRKAGDISSDLKKQLEEKSFLKLAKKIPLLPPEESSLMLTDDYKVLVKLLAD